MKILIFVSLLLFGCHDSPDHYTINNYPEIPVTDVPETEEHEGTCPEIDNPENTTLNCPKTKLIGFKDELTPEDLAALNTATKNCQKYYPDAPCLKHLHKKRDLVYHALCGKEND